MSRSDTVKICSRKSPILLPQRHLLIRPNLAFLHPTPCFVFSKAPLSIPRVVKVDSSGRCLGLDESAETPAAETGQRCKCLASVCVTKHGRTYYRLVKQYLPVKPREPSIIIDLTHELLHLRVIIRIRQICIFLIRHVAVGGIVFLLMLVLPTDIGVGLEILTNKGSSN